MRHSSLLTSSNGPVFRTVPRFPAFGETWNPVAGCSMISPGCVNCYAMPQAARLERMGQAKYADLTKRVDGRPVWNGNIRLDEQALKIPLGRKKPTMYFVNSMSDLFHKGVPEEFIAKVFAMMWECQWHTFQVLTKRAERMQSLMANPRMPWAVATVAWNMLKECSPEKAAYVTAGDIERDVMDAWPLPNVWLGVSTEDQQRLDERWPFLTQTPAAVRFISYEPALGPLDLSTQLPFERDRGGSWRVRSKFGEDVLLDWLIAGGESGASARPCNLEWFRNVRDQCETPVFDIDGTQRPAVALFVKQLGARIYIDPGDRLGFTDSTYHKVKHPKGGDMTEWPEDLRVREWPR